MLSGLGFFETEIPKLNTVTVTLAFFGVLYLVPYFQAMMRLLDPKKAITKLGQQINVKSLLNIVNFKEGMITPPEDPMFPLIGIGFKAIRENDLMILQLTLEEISKRHDEVIVALDQLRPKKRLSFTEVGSEVITSGKIREINEHFLNHSV